MKIHSSFAIEILLLLTAACSTLPKDELRVTKTETTTLRNDVTGRSYGACIITAVGHGVEVKAEDSWGGCPQVGSLLFRCEWKGTGFAHEVAESRANCGDSNNPAFYIKEEKEVR
jgi:hypothetical protein